MLYPLSYGGKYFSAVSTPVQKSPSQKTILPSATFAKRLQGIAGILPLGLLHDERGHQCRLPGQEKRARSSSLNTIPFERSCAKRSLLM